MKSEHLVRGACPEFRSDNGLCQLLWSFVLISRDISRCFHCWTPLSNVMATRPIWHHCNMEVILHASAQGHHHSFTSVIPWVRHDQWRQFAVHSVQRLSWIHITPER